MAFRDLAERVSEVRERIAAAAARGGRGQAVRLVAVTKMHGPDAVEAVFAAGVRDVGENRVQEALRKMTAVVAPVSWHLIGHLQRNKVKEASKFALIHSLDSLRLAEAMHAHCAKAGVTLEVLVQVNASGETTKSGFSRAELPAAAERFMEFGSLHVKGVMTMAALDATEGELRRTFADARDGLAVLRAAGHGAAELSMGMSQDYEIAVEEGATIVRLGTTLFGPRGD